MSEPGSGSAAATTRAPTDAGGANGGGVRHPRSFKLRFAAQREPGRSYVSPVKPLGVPATVTGKFYSVRERGEEEASEAEERALRRVRELVSRATPDADGHGAPAPPTSSQEYGRWTGRARRDPPVLDHRLRDSAWLKARLAVLAADANLRLPPR